MTSPNPTPLWRRVVESSPCSKGCRITSYNVCYTKLLRILQQLLSNAVKFTDGGRINIGVSNPDRDGERLLLRFSVSDTGVGIADEVAARLFHPFEQGSYNFV